MVTSLDDTAPELVLTPEQEQELDMYFQQFPVQDNDVEDLLSGLGREDKDFFQPVVTQRGQKSSFRGLSAGALNARKQRHEQLQSRKEGNPQFRQALERRQDLPAWGCREGVLDLVRSHQVVLVSGETGCGKSTQVPQFLLDDPDIGPSCHIACTQPRRISAISIAERIAEERAESIGQVVGYTIRLDSEISSSTQLQYMTPGILLRQLRSDPELRAYSHIIIDEVHERDKNSEFLLIILRDLINGPRAEDLKIILMSATLQTSKYSDYFGSCPVITIGAQMFPVQEFYLEDILVQTNYLEEMGIAMGSSSSLEQLFGEDHSRLCCVICGCADFKSPEEFGTHAAFCGLEEQQENLMEKIMSFVDETMQKSMEGKVEKSEDDEVEEDREIDEELESETEFEEKWDGFAPFVVKKDVTDAATAEMLQQYHMSFDDTMIDNDLVVMILEYICDSAYEDGAVLIFLPGWNDIICLKNILMQTPPYNNRQRFIIHALHSGIPTSDQRKVFHRPPKGVRKLILSTNIAETSITIDDVAFVINSGRVKEKNYDVHLKLSTLESVWTSKASTIQRKGRAGRVRAGVCFHLFSRQRYESMKEVQESELLRTSLEEVSLQAKSLGLAEGSGAVGAFLEKAVDPPHPKAISNAIELLQAIGAFNNDEQMTELGLRLCSIAIDPKTSKMILWASLLGCASAALTIGCAMTYRDPFMLPANDDQKKKAKTAKYNLSLGMESDFIALLRAVGEWNRIQQNQGIGQAYRFADQNFLMGNSLNMMVDITQQVARDFKRSGYPDPQEPGYWNANSGKLGLISNIVGVGVYPNVGFRQFGDTNFSTQGGQKAKINQGSVNALKSQKLSQPCEQEQELIAFADISRSSQLFLMSCTCPLDPLAMCLITGTLEVIGTESFLDDNYEEGDNFDEDDEIPATLMIDEWLRFSTSKYTAFQIQVLRLRLQMIFASYIRSPDLQIGAIEQCTLSLAATLLGGGQHTQQIDVYGIKQQYSSKKRPQYGGFNTQQQPKHFKKAFNNQRRGRGRGRGRRGRGKQRHQQRW